MFNVKNSPAEPEGAEGTICDTCRTIPISYLSLDVAEPVVGWLAFFGEENIEVAPDDLGRLSVPRRVLGELLAEREEYETRLAVQRAERAADARTPVSAGVPAQEGSTPFESLMMAPGYVSAREEFAGGRVNPTEEFMDAQFVEGQRRAAEQRAEAELLEKARRVLEGRDP